jgi:mannose-6-phosphate isomerase-like protein (cupin superfamily)
VPANVTYVLRNVGDKPLRILDVPQVQVLEGC